MLIIAITLGIVGIGLTCWLIFNLSVYALPFFVGLASGMAASQGGLGALNSLLVGVVAAFLTLGCGRLAFSLVKSVPLRTAIAAAFALPAGIAGYHAVLGLSQIGITSLAVQHVFAWFGALIIGATAWARMTRLARPGPAVSGGVVAARSEPVLTSAPRME